MRWPLIYLVSAAAMLLWSAGCSLSSMEKKVDTMTGRSNTTETRVELNTASAKMLAGLPGLTAADADRIIKARPYANRVDLVRKGVLSEGQFEQVKDQVFVEHAKG